MKFKNVLILIFIFIIAGCSNSEVKKNDPKEENYSIIRGINAAENGKYNEAITEFEKAYAMNKKNIITVKALGLAYSKAGDLQKGEAYFKEALVIDEFDTETLYNYAILKYEEKKYGESLELLNKIKIQNVDKKIIAAKGGIYYKKGDYENCYREMSKIISDEIVYPQDFYAIYIDSIKKSGRANLQYEFIYKKYKENKGNIVFVSMFKNYLDEIGAYEESEKVVKEYGEQKGYTTSILIMLAETAINSKKIESAKEYIEQISEEENMNVNVLGIKAAYYRAAGMNSEAERYENILKNVRGSEK